MKRGNLQSSADSEGGADTPTIKVSKSGSMYQKAGLASAGVRVITRSKARSEALESRHRPEGVPGSAALERPSVLVVAISTDPAPTPDVQLSSAQSSVLPSVATAAAKQKPDKHNQSLAVHGCPKLLATSPVRLTAYHNGTTLPASLLAQPSDALEQRGPAAANSQLVHPSLLQHPGRSSSRDQEHMHSIQQAVAPVAAAGQAHQHAASPVHARRSTAKQATSLSHTADNGSRDSGPSIQRQTSKRRVSFAPGPLSQQQHSSCTPDGHPATEGAHVARNINMSVSPMAPGYALDLTKGNVLFLENLLGEDCQMSVMRLKRRVGLLPPIKPHRPHVGTRPGQQDATAATAELDIGNCHDKSS